MGSGIIYVVVAVIWIAYFVPAWLRRHDEVSESKSVERYRDAMRVVARGTGAEVSVTLSERVEARQTMLRRRQQIFAGIIGMLLLTVGLSMFGLITPWIVALPVITFALYLAYERRAKVTEDLVMRREVIRAAHNLEVTVRPSKLSFAKAIQEPTLTIPAVSSGVHVIERRESVWEPAKVPVPTYVTAPKAVRAHRVIDLTQPGSWTAEQQAEEASRLSAIAPSRDEVFDQVAADAAATEISVRAANQ